jgi:hypothetical protein
MPKRSGLKRLITDAIDRIIDDRGQIRDSASSELSRIRKRLISEQAGIRKKAGYHSKIRPKQWLDRRRRVADDPEWPYGNSRCRRT